MRRLVIWSFVCAAWALMVSVQSAAAQFVGTFTWQTQPFCNRVTVNVTQAGNAYILEGFDNQCGGARRALATGAATLNPDGTVGLGLAIVNTPGGEPTHMDAVVNLQTLVGTWSDSGGNSGTFVFNGEGGGSPRPTNQVTISGFGTIPFLIGRRASATAATPQAVGSLQTLLRMDGRGHDGSGFTDPDPVRISMYSTQNWTPTAHGTAISFLTTENDTTFTSTRLLIDHDGQVGIGTLSPADLLDVNGDIRVGDSGTNGCLRNNNGGTLVGVCASDARFKRDVVAYSNVLLRISALRPVQFSWRSEAFPERGFGSARETGLIAQEVELVLPELVTTDRDGYKAVNYGKLPLLALQAIKELKEKNDALERRLADLEARVKP